MTNFICIATVQRNVDMFDLTFILRNKLRNAKSSTKFSRWLSILYVLVIIFIPFNIAAIVLQYEAGKVKYPIALSTEYWCFNLTIGLLSCIIHYIKEIFENANSFLTDRILANFYFTGKIINSVIINDMRFITKHHNNICNLLDDFNNAFTPLMAFVLLALNVLILWDFGMIILLRTKLSTEVIHTHVYIFGVAGLIVFGQGAIAAWAGEQLAEEGTRTTKICYQLLNSVPSNMSSETKIHVEKQLRLLLEQSKSHKVSVHAGGFFQVNFGILGSIASTVTTYSIVIVQFLLKTNNNTYKKSEQHNDGKKY
ncbi:hypothetical protein HUJ04_010151 [Dendroctonus ponderosae]|nr:hypothetical protein HUJ04_010151 [Dendroctonus ponderosae]